jgi:DNA-binding MarR family transcriptional regulator
MMAGVPRRNPVPDALVDELLSVSRTLVGISARSVAQIDEDVTLPQYRALVVLAGQGPQRSVDVARELGIAPSTMTRLCDRLVRKGLVGRYHRSDDRRPVWLVLTKTGKKLVGDVMRARRKELARLVAEAGITGRESVLDALRAFVEAAGDLPDDRWWRQWAVSTTVPRDAWPAQAASGNARAS